MNCVDTTFLVDLWIAAWAMQHAAPLVARNTKHFKGISDLELINYSMS